MKYFVLTTLFVLSYAYLLLVDHSVGYDVMAAGMTCTGSMLGLGYLWATEIVPVPQQEEPDPEYWSKEDQQ